MSKKIKILFFTPYAGYTGSEMMLWYLLSGLDKNTFEVKLFAGKKGELLNDFPSDIEVDHARAGSHLLFRLADKLLKKFNLKGLDERRILNVHRRFSPHYWYINTMAMPSVAEIAIKNKIKYIVHFHELLTQYGSLSHEQLQNMVAQAELAVGCAEKVCDNLKVLGAKKIQKQYECVDFSRIQAKSQLNLSLREKLNIPASAFIIVMSGQRIERKGFDLFVETALRSLNEPYHFLWLGSSKHSGYEFFLENLIKEKKSNNITLLSPSQNDYYHYLDLADLFFLSSREDPFPLVMLEAAYLGKPILAFNSGGSAEFVTSEIGTILNTFSEEAIDAGIKHMHHQIKNKHYQLSLIQEHAKIYDAAHQIKLFQNWLSKL